MTRISANLITLDAEQHLAACLESLRWVDEIVIVDGGSRDGTREIARQYTDRVYLHPFDDFATQRNRALDLARGEWILSMDADERVDAALAREIRESIAPVSRLNGFWVPIRSRIFGRRFRFAGTQGEQKMRLFRRNAGRWRGAVHETVALSGPVGRLHHAIDHFSTPDIATYWKKFARYSVLERNECGTSNQRTSHAVRRASADCRLATRSAWIFAKLYFGKLGLLDGPEGFWFCALSAWSHWLESSPHPKDRMHGQLETNSRRFERIKEDWHDPAVAIA